MLNLFKQFQNSQTKNRHFIRLFFVILTLILLTSCSIFDTGDSSIIEIKRSWEIEQFFNEEGGEVTLNEDEPLTLRFSNGYELSGDADCNIFGGEYRAKEKV